MLRLKAEQRRVLVEKLPDVANLVVGALFLGQFLNGRPFSPGLAAVGMVIWAAIMMITMVIAGDEWR